MKTCSVQLLCLLTASLKELQDGSSAVYQHCLHRKLSISVRDTFGKCYVSTTKQFLHNKSILRLSQLVNTVAVFVV